MATIILSIIIGTAFLLFYNWFKPYVAPQHEVMLDLICITTIIVSYLVAVLKTVYELNLLDFQSIKRGSQYNKKVISSFYGKHARVKNDSDNKFEKARFYFNTNRNEEGREYLQSIKDKNNKAQALYGYALIRGLYGFKQDKEVGFEYLNGAFDKKIAVAYVYYSILYREGIGVRKSVKKANELLDIAVRAKEPMALVEKGHLILDEAQDKATVAKIAWDYFSTAYRENNNYGYDEIANLYLDTPDYESGLSAGYIYESYLLLSPKTALNLYLRAKALFDMKKTKKAKNLYLKLASERYEPAMIKLIEMQMTGDDEKNVSQVIEYVNYCNKNGNADSYWYTGYGYQSGFFGEVDLEKAKAWYLKCVPDSAYTYAILGRIENEKGNEKEAEKFFKAGADLDDLYSISALGGFYLENGRTEDAINAFAKGVSLGSGECAYELADIYIIKKSDKKSFEKYLKTAIDLGNMHAALKLAICYKDGDVFEQNYDLAFKYMKIAAEGGNGEAQARLGSMYADGYGCKRDFDQSFYWIQKSALGGCYLGQFYLAGAYEQGLGCEIDLKKSKYWEEKGKQTLDEQLKCLQ